MIRKPREVRAKAAFRLLEDDTSIPDPQAADLYDTQAAAVHELQHQL